MESHIYRYKITLKQQAILLSHMVIIWIGLMVGCVYLLKINLNNIAFIYIAIFCLLIDTIPTVILHTQYWIKNHEVVFLINTDVKELQYETPTKQLKYSFTDITSLQYYRNLGKGSGWNSFGEYRYYKIIFNDEIEIIITCLMINDIENTLEMLLCMKAEEHAKLLCLIE